MSWIKWIAGLQTVFMILDEMTYRVVQMEFGRILGAAELHW